MPPLELKGNTLGEKHKYYNEQLKMNIERGPLDNLTNISYDESDIDNLFKIDIASNRKNVDYILEVLKCEDMLYVSRAVKISKWIITDDNYSHIVNPSYLHSQLFPHMSSKAVNKFMLNIRLHLKNANRVEEFFDYYKDDNISVALKWLPNCSIAFIETATQAYYRNISISLLKRLCKKSKTVLQIYLKERKLHDKGKEKEAIKFRINTNVHEFLETIQTFEDYELPYLSPKITRIIMKIAPDRILGNFEKYAFHIHLPTFVKSRCFESENADRFLLKLYKNKKMHSWFREDNIKSFLLIMPPIKRSNFVKNFLIDRKFDDANLECKNQCCASDNIENDCVWYKYVMFEIAFVELKKLIHVESSPSERINIFKILLRSAGQDMENIHFVLKYFRDKHINEPNVFKTSFIAAVIEQVTAFRLKDETWQILNEIFRSMDVYTESEQNTQFCVNVILVRKILNNELIPENIAVKCLFETLSEYRNHLNEHDSGKVFDYLYHYKIEKLQNQKNVSTKSEFTERVNIVLHLLILLTHWEKDLVDFPLLLTEIRDLIKINNENLFNVNLSRLYTVNKGWRKCMFAESLDLQPTQEVLVNALKHDPNLLCTTKSKLQSLYFNNGVNMKPFLYKVRTYWSSSIAVDNISFLLDQIDQGNDKSLIRHTFVLLPKKTFVELVTKYVPEKQFIDWDTNDEVLLDIQKNIARYLYYARPQVPFEVVTSYAKGDYLKFAIPSLTAVLSNMSANSVRNHIKKFMNTPVSLRKHAIRIASDKLKIHEVVNIFDSAWINTENKSIRAVLFEHTFKILCKEKNTETVKIIWQLLENFIDSLTDSENEVIYKKLTEVNRVPLCVRVAFWKKSYKFLSDMSITVKSVLPKIINTVNSSIHFMDIVDVDFIAEIFHQNKDTIVSNENNNYIQLISRCLLATKSIDLQNERYQKVFLPIMKLFLSHWDKKHGNDYIVRSTFCDLLKCLCNDFNYFVVPNKMLVPAIVFNDIKQYLEHNLPAEENYTLVTSWKLVSTFLNILSIDISKTDYKKQEESKMFEGVITNECDNALTVAKFGKKSLECLIDDITLYNTSIHISFAYALKLTSTLLRFDPACQFLFIRSFINFDVMESYLVALMLLPQYVSPTSRKEKNEILDILCLHTSPEVKMHYYLYNEKSYL